MNDDDRPAVRHRAHAMILLYRDHRTFDDVAPIFNIHLNTIRNWTLQWQEEGFAGLYDLEGRGANPIFSEEEEKLILKYLDEDPRSIQKVMARVEQETGKKADKTTFRKIIKKPGKIWKRQRKFPRKQPSDEEYKKGQEEIDEIKPLAQDGEFEIVYFDASGVSLQPVVPYAWQDRGREGTLKIPASSSARVNLLGFLNPKSQLLTVFEPFGSVNSATIIDAINAYCEQLTHPAVVLLDNAPIHTSKKVSQQVPIWERKGLSLYFIPSYSPQFNLIEILWRKIKYEWLPSWAYLSREALMKALDSIIDGFGSKYMIKFSTI